MEDRLRECKCDMRTSLVGDGCRYCNPQYYIDMLEEQIKDADTDPLMEEMADAAIAVISFQKVSQSKYYKSAVERLKLALQEYREMEDAK